MNFEQAIKASRNGATAAFISGTLTALVFLYALSANADGFIGIWNDPTIVVDVIIIFGCAIGMMRNSRAAAITITVYWVFSKAFLYIESGQATGLGVGLILLYFYGKAIQGSFAYHRIRKDEDPDYQAAPRWYYYVGIPSGLIFALLTGFGLLTMTGHVPSTEVVAGSTLTAEDRDSLVANGILYEDEEIEFFYSFGLVSILEGGSILTDRAVVSYFVNDDQQLVPYELAFDQVRNIELYQEGNYLNDAIYRIESYEEDAWIAIQLSTEGRGDVRFVEALRDKVHKVRTDPVSGPAFDSGT